METTISFVRLGVSMLRERNTLVSRLQTSAIFSTYQRAFQTLTGLPLVLRATGAFQSALQGAKNGNAFCALMAQNNKTCAACLNLQHRLEATACERAATLECFAGLRESAIPIRVGENVVAYLQTGQVLFRQPTAAQSHKAVRRVAELERSVDLSELEAAYRQTHVVGRTQYESIISLLGIFAQQLSVLSNDLMVKHSFMEAPSITRARTYIAEHLTENISLLDVSRAVGMSSFYFCKNFKKGTGLTFTNYLSRVRVEAVKQLLLDPYKRVSEAAFEAGFQSLSQFNRVFHRVAGQPPSVYREQLHSPAQPFHAHRSQVQAA